MNITLSRLSLSHVSSTSPLVASRVNFNANKMRLSHFSSSFSYNVFGKISNSRMEYFLKTAVVVDKDCYKFSEFTQKTFNNTIDRCVNVELSTFFKCSSTDYEGAAIRFTVSNQLYIFKSSFISCVSPNNGGVIYSKSNNFEFAQSCAYMGKTTNGVSFVNAVQSNINNAAIDTGRYSTPDASSTALKLSAGAHLIKICNFSQNSGNVGSVISSSTTDLTIDYASFVQNVATNIIDLAAKPKLIQNINFAENIAINGGLVKSVESITIKDVVFQANLGNFVSTDSQKITFENAVFDEEPSTNDKVEFSTTKITDYPARIEVSPKITVWCHGYTLPPLVPSSATKGVTIFGYIFAGVIIVLSIVYVITRALMPSSVPIPYKKDVQRA